jgi:hypothetical protein
MDEGAMNRHPVLSHAQREVLETAHFFLDDRAIARYGTLSGEDLARMERCRRDSNLFGFAVQLCVCCAIQKLGAAAHVLEDSAAAPNGWEAGSPVLGLWALGVILSSSRLPWPTRGERQKVGGQGKSAQAEVMADPIPFKRLTLEQFYAT